MTEAGAAEAAGEGERDEPPRERATPRRFDEQPFPERQTAGDEGEALPDPNELDALRLSYVARIAAAQLTAPKGQRGAMVRALRMEMKAAMREITERRRHDRQARREARALRRPTRPEPF